MQGGRAFKMECHSLPAITLYFATFTSIFLDRKDPILLKEARQGWREVPRLLFSKWFKHFLEILTSKQHHGAVTVGERERKRERERWNNQPFFLTCSEPKWLNQLYFDMLISSLKVRYLWFHIRTTLIFNMFIMILNMRIRKLKVSCQNAVNS